MAATSGSGAVLADWSGSKRSPEQDSSELPAFVDDVWEPCAPSDRTQADDLAGRMPDELRELQWLFLVEARKYNVLPLDDRRVERFDATIAGRPQLVAGRRQILHGGMSRLTDATRPSSTSRTSRAPSPTSKCRGRPISVI